VAGGSRATTGGWRRLPVTALVALGLAGLVGCSDGPSAASDGTGGATRVTITITLSPGTPAHTATKACDLITSAEAGLAMGGSAVNVATNLPDRCEYDHGQDSLTLTYQPQLYSADVVTLMLDSLGSKAQRTALGDGAIVFRPDSTQTQYHIWVHGHYVELVLTSFSNNAGADQPAAQLARIAAVRA
jgi:hypothetical protein